MHGLIAGLWSSLSGAGRFVSRTFSGFLIDSIGFDKTAAVATALQIIVVSTALNLFHCIAVVPESPLEELDWTQIFSLLL
jgi:hypothetical protein